VVGSVVAAGAAIVGIGYVGAASLAYVTAYAATCTASTVATVGTSVFSAVFSYVWKK
jgi:hypothetical protein